MLVNARSVLVSELRPGDFVDLGSLAPTGGRTRAAFAEVLGVSDGMVIVRDGTGTHILDVDAHVSVVVATEEID